MSRTLNDERHPPFTAKEYDHVNLPNDDLGGLRVTVQHTSPAKPPQPIRRTRLTAHHCRIGYGIAAALLLPLLTAGCIGGGSSGNPLIDAGIGASNLNTNCAGFCVDAQPNAFLTVADVQTVIAQAVGEAQARGRNATIAVTDRVGNVLAVFATNNADGNAIVTSQQPEARNADRGVLSNPTGLEGLAIVPTNLAAIAKAVARPMAGSSPTQNQCKAGPARRCALFTDCRQRGSAHRSEPCAIHAVADRPLKISENRPVG